MDWARAEELWSKSKQSWIGWLPMAGPLRSRNATRRIDPRNGFALARGKVQLAGYLTFLVAGPAWLDGAKQTRAAACSSLAATVDSYQLRSASDGALARLRASDRQVGRGKKQVPAESSVRNALVRRLRRLRWHGAARGYARVRQFRLSRRAKPKPTAGRGSPRQPSQGRPKQTKKSTTHTQALCAWRLAPRISSAQLQRLHASSRPFLRGSATCGCDCDRSLSLCDSAG